MLKLVSAYFLHKLQLINPVKLHHYIFRKIFLGQDSYYIKCHVDLFIIEHLNKYLYSPAIMKLEQAKHHQHYISILSNSPDFIVGPVANFLKIGDWKATVYDIDEKGKFSTISSFCDGEQKADYLKKLCERFNLVKENVIAYSDSYLDIPFLIEAGIAVAVNPDKKLKSLSIEKKWEII
jgi:phosphoserine phosphatase